MIPSAKVRELLEVHGECRPQDSSDWTGTVPLPAAVATFYREVGPVDIVVRGYGNSTSLPSLSALWDCQAGYRWNGVSGEIIEDWNPDWLVVADEGADPYIFAGSSVMFAQHGAGSWEPDELFPDLNTMAAAIATLGGVLLEAGDSFTDDDCFIRAEHREKAINRLAELLGSRTEAEVSVVTAGWG